MASRHYSNSGSAEAGPMPNKKSKKKKQLHTAHNWFDPAPFDYLYPWTDLNIPWIPCEVQTFSIAGMVKDTGNECFKNGDFYDALWKYEHSYLLFDSMEIMKEGVDTNKAVLHSNIAACCLKLGDDGRVELLRNLDVFPNHQIMWYGYAHQHSHQAIEYDPPRKVAWKAYKRRGESFKKMIGFPGMQNAMQMFLPPFSSPYSNIIHDYIESCWLQDHPDPKVFYEALTMAVDEDLTDLIPTLGKPYVNCGFTTKLLTEAVNNPSSKLEHIEFLLFDLNFVDCPKPRFNASSVSVSALLRKEMFSLEIYKELIECGTRIAGEDVNVAINLIPPNKLNLFKLLVSKYPVDQGETDTMVAFCDSAKKLNKQSFLEILKNNMMLSYPILKQEGNALFSRGNYEQALGKYFEALKYCRERNMTEEMSIIRANCAQACLKLQLFSDAFTHSSECIRLNKNNHKGYYRRAESRKALLQGSTEHGTYSDVVRDYLKCHLLSPSVDVYTQAVILAVQHGCSGLISCLGVSDVTSGFSKEFFKHLMTSKYTLNDKLLHFVVMNLPDPKVVDHVYDASFLDMKTVVQKITEGPVLKRLLRWHICVRDEDVLAAVKCLVDNQVDIFECILNHSTHTDDAFHSSVNIPCREALALRKKRLVITLIKHGATPPPEMLYEVEGLCDDLSVQRYIKRLGKGVTSTHRVLDAVEKLAKEEREEISSNDVEDLNNEAKKYFKRGDTRAATRLFKKALRLCEQGRLRSEASAIHNNLARLFLETREYNSAFKHCEASIDLCPTNPKAYSRKAEAVSCAQRVGRPITGYSLSDAINSYKTSYRQKEDIKVLVEALLIAGEIRNVHMLTQLCESLPLVSCNKILQLLLPRPNCKAPLLSYLLLELWPSRNIDCSTVQMKTLLQEKRITEEKLLARFMLLGVVVYVEDVRLAMRCLSPTNIAAFSQICGCCQQLDVNLLCREALALQKMAFVLHFIKMGAAFPEDGCKMFMEALKAKDFTTAKNLIDLMDKKVFEEMELGHLLDNTNLGFNTDLVELLIKAGVKLHHGKSLPIPVVMTSQIIHGADKIKVLSVLVERGVNCNQLCRTAQRQTTPLHVATDLAIKYDGATELIEAVVASSSFEKSSKLLNDKGETPLHLAVKPHLKKGVSTTVLSCLLQSNIIDPSLGDKNKKRPRDYIKDEKDERARLFDDAIIRFNPVGKKKSKKRNKNKKKTPLDYGTNHKSHETPSIPNSTVVVDILPKTKPPKEVIYEELSILDKLKYQLNRVNKMDMAYFKENTEVSSPKLAMDVSHKTVRQQLSPMVTIVSPKSSPSKPSPSHRPNSMTEPLLIASPSGDFSLEGLNFDSLPWEVEVTRNVVKFFKNTKKFSPKERIGAARVIYSIAEGKRNMHLAKAVMGGGSQKVALYEARVTDASRILWEKAINFSQKLTTTSDFPVYSQVIRVWEVILDHDDLDRRIRYCSEQICSCYERGYLSSVHWGLKPIGQQSVQTIEGVRGKEKRDFPHTYTKDLALTKPEHQFVPAASTSESEYSVTTFYCFDTVTVKSMISGSNEKRDYPFKEWHKENEVIRITAREAILLLGRSGTGKTTCCLYRLWNEFKNYWNPDSASYHVKIPRRALVSLSLDTSDDESELSSDEEPPGDDLDNTFTEDPLPDESAPKSKHRSHSSGSGGPGPYITDDKIMGVVEEDLHQLFVTKNYVLCDQMKKRFFCMVAGCDFLEPHLQFEESTPPNSFTKYEDLSFPAFLTARQFYILLDNSLGGENSFFKRDAEGNLQVKISSLDYDHEDFDTLLDLEQSDSEDEDMEMQCTVASSSSSSMHTAPRQQWTEVTALYFKEIIWPKISHECGKDFDPMLVWLEIQSFIKGSEFAVDKGAPLSLAEYKDVGNRMAPNFSSHREAIYKLFKKYYQFVRKSRHSNFLFDECDLVLDIHNRLKRTRDVSWSIHSVYIDEVQDFTQAELAVFIRCCRDPNSMFFTGDTAQSIMRGIAFRFQDLRSCFHRINSKVPYINVPKEPLKLTINYRSHSGILKLAGSIIDLISEFFKDSIDHLPDDEGMFPGPMPVFLDSCKETDLSLLFSANKRECSAIEFGAHQVILVQSKEAKDKLPDILKGAITLTIFEAKGLEFDDVLIYNFFTDSLVDEKGWRVVTSYLEMPGNKKQIENMQPLSGPQPRSKAFNPTLHKSLNAELKYLYTAITRAKCNLWIYDSNMKNRLPMLDYWHKRNAVKIVTGGGTHNQKWNLVFASNSTSEQWRAQGDNFRKRHLWEQAILCYERAGAEFSYLAKEAHAYHNIQVARRQNPQLFQNAALSFMERDALKHSVHCLTGAALCLKNSRPPKHNIAAKLFEKLGDLTKAAQCFLKDRDFDNFSRILESLGEYNSVIRSLQGKPFMKKREALIKAAEYEKKGYVLDPKFTPSELSFSCAKFYLKKDKRILLEVLQYMPEQERRVKFMKEAGLFEEAFDDYTENHQHNNAFRLASARGWFEKGIGLAQSKGDEMSEARFILQQAKGEYLSMPPDFNKSDVSPEVISNLKKVVSLMKDKLMQAEAHILLGMLLKSKEQCITARGLFKLQNHKAGIVEAFDRMAQFGKVSDQEILNCAHTANKLSTSLEVSRNMNVDVKQTVKFCGLQLIGRVYLTSPFCNVWVSLESLQKYESKEEQDVDGMLCLKQEVREDVIAAHYKKFIDTWLEKFNVESRLFKQLQLFKLHSQLLKKRSLSRQYSQQEVSSLSLREYLQACVNFLELKILSDPSMTASITVHILSIFSPSVYIYLPQRLTGQHVQTVRLSLHSQKCFQDLIKSEIDKKREEEKERVLIDGWLYIWRASCISLPDMKFLREKISQIESDVNKERESGNNYIPPPGFIFWKSDQRFCHIFSLWLNSCTEMRDKSNGMLWSSKLVINHFLGSIADDKRISISVMNCVDILTVHCTALLAMITVANSLQNIPTSFTVPLIYKHSVDVFSCMNCRRSTSDKSLLAACVEQVPFQNHSELFRQCKHLLNRTMGYLIGAYRHAPWFGVLKFGLRNYCNFDATRLCLILTLTIFGNLAMLKVNDLMDYGERIIIIVKKAARSSGSPPYIQKVCNAILSNHRTFTRPSFVFSLVADLLHDSNMDSTITKLFFRQKPGARGHIEFVSYQQPPEFLPEAPLQLKKSPNRGQSSPNRGQSDTNTKSQVNSTPSTEKLMVSSQFGMVQSSQSDIFPLPSKPVSAQAVSPPTAPIGSERRKANIAATSTFSQSVDPLPSNLPAATSVLNPSPLSYIPEFSSSATTGPPSFQHYYPKPEIPAPSHVPVEGTNVDVPIEGSSVDSSVDRRFFPASSFNYFPDATPNTTQLGYNLGAPGVAPPTLDVSFSQPSNSPFGAGCYFKEDNFSYAQDEMTAETSAPDMDLEHEESYTLTQPQPSQFTFHIDPALTDEGIIDEANHYCNVCGIFYQRGEAHDFIPEQPTFEKYLKHVQSQTHHDNTVLYKRFKLLTNELADGSDASTLIQLAKQKLNECRKWKAEIETEELDQEIDVLKDQIHHYDQQVSDTNDTRDWSDGIKKIESINHDLSRFVQTAADQLNKIIEVKRQFSLPKVEEEDEFDAIDQLASQTLDEEQHKQSKRNSAAKIRSAEEKAQSREKKKHRRRK